MIAPRNRERAARTLLAAGALCAALTLAACTGTASGARETVRPTPPSGATGTPSADPVPTATVVPGPTVTIDPEPSASSDAAGAVDCQGGALSFGVSGETIVVTGECAEIALGGSGVSMDASSASIARLVVNGNAMDIDAAVVDSVQISGQDNAVTASQSSTITINGDRNSVDTGGTVEVSIGGNDNTVRADAIAGLIQSGDRNDVAAR